MNILFLLLGLILTIFSQLIIQQTVSIQSQKQQDNNSHSNMRLLQQINNQGDYIIQNEGQKQEEKVQNQQLYMYEQEQQKLNEQLQPWIQKQKKQIESVKPYFGNLQHYSFILNKYSIDSFEINLNKKKKNETFYFQISVYIEQEQRFIMPNSTIESQFLTFIISQKRMINSTRTGGTAFAKKNIYLQGKFYFDPPKEDHYYLNFINKYNRQLFIQLSIQYQNLEVNSLSVEQVDPYAAILSNIFQQMKQQSQKRKFSYKWQWGFKEKQDQHQSNLLALTGIELIAIIITAIIQMCCLRSLLDNRSVI